MDRYNRLCVVIRSTPSVMSILKATPSTVRPIGSDDPLPGPAEMRRGYVRRGLLGQGNRLFSCPFLAAELG